MIHRFRNIECPNLGSRGRFSLFLAIVCLVLPVDLRAADKPEAAETRAAAAPVSLADPQALLHIRIHKPLQVLDNPWIQEILKKLDTSPSARQHLEALQGGRLAEMRQFLERASGEPWRVGIEKLTAGGIEFALQKRPTRDGQKPEHPYAALLVIHSGDGRLLHKFLAAADQERREKLGEQAGLLEKREAPPKGFRKREAPQVSNYTYRRHHCTKVVKGHDRPGEYFAAVGRKFLFTTDEKLLEELINRCSEMPEAGGWRKLGRDQNHKPAPEVAPPTLPDQPILSFSARLGELRQVPQLAELLGPTSDPWLAPFAEFRTSLRQAERIEGAVHVEASGLRLRLVSSPASTEIASATKAAPLSPPLLRLQNTVTSVSFSRDLSQLWKQREEWLAPAGIQQVEGWNKSVSSKVANLDLLENLNLFGTQWRLALTELPPLPDAERARLRAEYQKAKAEQAKSGAGKTERERTRRPSRFPAAVLAVNLTDEAAFRRDILDRLETHFQSPAGQAVGQVEKSDHHGVAILTLRLNAPPPPPEAPKTTDASDAPQRDAEKAAPRAPGQPHAGRFERTRRWEFPWHRHSQPSCAIRNGQLIFGSTVEIVRQTIDELERESTRTPADSKPPSGINGEQLVSLAKVADHFHTRSRFMTWRLTKSGEWTEERAQQELAAFEGVLRLLGDLTWQESSRGSSLQIDVRLGK